MVQRLKRSRGFGPLYKPSVLANEDRVITAHALDASSETQMIAPMLDQSARVTGMQAEEVLLDAGYFDDEVIEATLARDVSLLCPEGQWPARPRDEGLFHKSAFDYHPQTDTYHSPAGQTLILLARSAATLRTREHRVYGATTCGDCHLPAKCTKAAQGRRIRCFSVAASSQPGRIGPVCRLPTESRASSPLMVCARNSYAGQCVSDCREHFDEVYVRGTNDYPI
jgi:hypothetical protein